MKRLESMLQRLKVRLLRLDVILHPLSGLLLSLKAGLRRLDGACQKVCVEGQTRGQEDMRRPKTKEEEKMPGIVHAVACSPAGSVFTASTTASAKDGESRIMISLPALPGACAASLWPHA